MSCKISVSEINMVIPFSKRISNSLNTDQQGRGREGEGKGGEGRGKEGRGHTLNPQLHQTEETQLTLCEVRVGGPLGMACLVQHQVKELVPQALHKVM